MTDQAHVIPCPVPDCATTFQADLPQKVLLALIDLHKESAHHVAALAPTARTKPDGVKRPTISAAGTSEDWHYFLQRWTDYKQATHLGAADIPFQLLECCDEALRKDLTRTFGALTTRDEATILRASKPWLCARKTSWSPECT
jgi:hypothetical protein